MAWFGSYEIRVTSKSEIYSDEIYGAFVSVVIDCTTEAEFRERASQALIEDHYEILGVEDVLQIDLENSYFYQSEEEQLLEQLNSGRAVAYGSFHTYPKGGLDA